MPFWYHGTTKENADRILKEGFKEGTYFAKGMDTAMVQGGEYIFWVWFDEDPTKYWEHITREPMGLERVGRLIKTSPELLYESKEIDRHVKMINFRERHGNDIIFCENCGGRGQMEDIGLFVHLRDRRITVCPKCGGFGCTSLDGTKMNQTRKKDD